MNPMMRIVHDGGRFSKDTIEPTTGIAAVLWYDWYAICGIIGLQYISPSIGAALSGLTIVWVVLQSLHGSSES